MSLRSSRKIRKYPVVPWIGLALILGLFYLTVSKLRFGFLGFPLDDAWIHQTYSRNLAYSGQLAFTPGLPSAGSTSPLWTLLVSVGYLLRIPFPPYWGLAQLWTYSLGILFLGLTGWTVSRLGARLFPESGRVGLWAGLFAVFEWHLIWAAVSGMETILFVWLSLFLVEQYLRDRGGQSGLWPSLGLGLLGGALVLTRPEGLGLVGLIGLDLARRWAETPARLKPAGLPSPALAQSRAKLGERGKESGTDRPGAEPNREEARGIRSLLWQWAGIVVGLALITGPYLAFHLYLTGWPFPNTLYAKQAEYGEILNSFSLWQRLFGGFGPAVESVQGVFRVIFIGAQFLLLPGLAAAGWLSLKERRGELLLIWGWWMSYLLLYGLRLPVTYQHGRYQIPAIAWVVLLGVWGTTRLVTARPGEGGGMLRRVVGRAWVMSLAILAGAFVIVGGQAYGRDVRFIESEMVATARWLDQNVGPDVLIAVHDIGAIGYFSQRRLIDLAGLITPEVIPFIRDEAALFDFIRAKRVDYLVTFPSWYPEMTRQETLQLRYKTGAAWGPQVGDNMAVYEVRGE